MSLDLQYMDAQQYYREVRQKAGESPEYAMKLYSSPGQRDGLYWDKKPGWPDSPLGKLTANVGSKVADGEAFFGYNYRFLDAQGPSAKGGARSYRVKGKLTGGFGIVAFPARYGDTGVLTYIANQDGTVYQRNLGPRTSSIATKMKRFDPDSQWEKAKKPGATPG